MHKKLIVIALAGLAASSLAQADEEKAEGPWSGKVAVGYLASEGNTESTSATAEFEANYAVNAWEHSASGRFFSSSDAEGTTAENYLLGWQSKYNFTENNYGYGAVDWIKNRFSGYPRQTFVTAGYGRRIINSDTMHFDAEIGAGYADQKAKNAFPPPDTISEDGALGTASLDFLWNWTENSDFGQYFGANYTSANTYWESITKVSAKINSSLALAVSYTVQGNTDVAPGIEKTDRFTAITLDYSF